MEPKDEVSMRAPITCLSNRRAVPASQAAPMDRTPVTIIARTIKNWAARYRVCRELEEMKAGSAAVVRSFANKAA